MSSSEAEVPAPAGPAVGEDHGAGQHGALAHATRLMRHSVELFEEVLQGITCCYCCCCNEQGSTAAQAARRLAGTRCGGQAGRRTF